MPYQQILLIGYTLLILSPRLAKAAPIELQNCTPCQETREACARRSFEAKNLSDVEALARLVFSESLSTGYWKDRCQAQGGEAKIFEEIAWGVINRVGRNPAPPNKIKDIVFARSQFATSFSNARPNPFAAAFLCPLRAQAYLDGASPGKPNSAAALYAQAEATAQRVLTAFNQGGIPPRRQNISNFFYPRSEYFGEMRPSWAPNHDPIKNRGFYPILGTQNPCVEFYCLNRPCGGDLKPGAAPAGFTGEPSSQRGDAQTIGI